MKRALKLEKMKQQAIGKIILNLVEITNQKDMADIEEFVSNKIFEECEGITQEN